MPLMGMWAKKLGAELNIIDTPVFNQPSVTYEKFQLYEKSRGYDWTLFVDADTLIHPDCPDWTELVRKDTVIFNGLDLSLNRFRSNDYIRRSSNLHGACTWFVLFSDWCRDVWHPMFDGMTFEKAMENIQSTQNELCSGVCSQQHLIDDYLVTQNFCRFGLKVATVTDLLKSIGHGGEQYMFHLYAISAEQKLAELNRVIREVWKIEYLYK